ncbi:hypothetical protein BDZ45DRAFT_639723 [Acephala macrosclerotiorum]|nr:hypothetical protein BDZ45DRAFT_639723 [Acephala macrosclerotiorum]
MMDSSSVWNGQDPTLSVSSQDDFQQFLDMGGMNNLGEGLPFEFQDFNPAQAQGQGQQMMNQDEGESMDAAMEGGRGMMGQDTTMQDQMPAMTTSASHPGILGGPLNGHASGESLSDLDAQINFLQQQRHHQQQRQLQEQQRSFYAQQRMGVPPTPQSMEMHGNPSQFYQQHSDPQQQAMYERFRMQVKEQQEMAFTPLVSPAVTPLEAHFSIPEYTVPGAYFSPLSSPALHAQNEHQSVYDQRHSGTTNSPIDPNLDTQSAPGSTNIVSRKTSKKSLQKPRNTRAVRQSPIVKPRKGKKGTITSQALGDIIEPPYSQPSQSKEATSSHSAASTEESENGSISPEHLSDMAPPPIPTPGSAGRSPYIQAQNQAQKGHPRTQQLVLGSPATPASLMRLASSPLVDSANQNMDIDDPGMDGFALPEAANSNRPQLSRLDTQSDGQITPTLSSTVTKTPGFHPLPSPAFSRPRTAASASQSPQIETMNGSNGTNGHARKTPQISGRTSKKRSSSSVLASPALLPRISPSIKPLLPGGGKVSEDTASLLLASKSNYQNILEGTHLPGVSYPTELSTNLTSKRTSHKIAEQGRRNRINSALQEIATLLPKGQTKDSGGEKSGSGDGDGNEPANGKGTAQSANSKASTVEQAIEFIKQLKKEQEQLRSDLAKERAEKEELKSEVIQLKQKV